MMNSFDIYTFVNIDTLYNILSCVSGGGRYLVFVSFAAATAFVWRRRCCNVRGGLSMKSFLKCTVSILMVGVSILPTTTIRIHDISGKNSPTVKKIENFPWALGFMGHLTSYPKPSDRKTPEKINQEGK